MGSAAPAAAAVAPKHSDSNFVQETNTMLTFTFSKCLSVFILQDLLFKCINNIADDVLGVSIHDDVEEMTQTRHVLHAPVDGQVRAVAVVKVLREVIR